MHTLAYIRNQISTGILLFCVCSSQVFAGNAVRGIDPGAQVSDEIVEEYQQDIIREQTREVEEGIRRQDEVLETELNQNVTDQEEVAEDVEQTTDANQEAVTTRDEDDTDQQAVSATETAEESVADESTELTFDVWEYRVEGNDLLGRGDIERTVYPYMGPDKTIDTVEAARASLEQTYRNKGYGTVFVDIPEQDVNNGVVILKVTEGTIERVRITGSRYYSLGKIREQIPALAEGTTPHLPEVQKQLSGLNKGVAGRVITPVMKPGKTPGKVEVELKVKDEFPLHGSLEINDRYTSDTSRLRLNANVRYDNLWQLGHSASIGYVVAPEDRSEVEVIFGTYLLRFPGSNNLLALYAVDSSSDVATTGDINQLGAGSIYGARAIFPLPALNKFSHSLTLGMDYKDFDETTRLLGVDALNTPISYASFITAYTGNWYHDSSTTSFTAEARIAPRGFGNTTAEFENKRAGAKPNFAFLKASLEHERQMYFGSRLNIKLQSQFSDSPLISNEQFSAGGMDTVRGYLESQQLGDDGLVGSLEIHSPSFARHIGEFLDDFHFLAFVEGARLKIQEPLPDQTKRFTLASTGVGMQMTAYEGLNAELLWAMVLSDNDDIESGDSRFHFNLGYEF